MRDKFSIINKHKSLVVEKDSYDRSTWVVVWSGKIAQNDDNNNDHDDDDDDDISMVVTIYVHLETVIMQ